VPAAPPFKLFEEKVIGAAARLPAAACRRSA
jgi:hypothetical protein